MLQIFIECRIMVDRGAHIQAFTFASQDHGRLSIVRISKHSCVWCVQCVVCACRVVCCACVVCGCACVLSVCGCAFCVLVVWCIVVCVGLCVGLCVVLCLWCVVCGAAWHAEKPQCVGSKRLRVKVQNASVCAGKTRACVEHARVLPAHTGAF